MLSKQSGGYVAWGDKSCVLCGYPNDYPLGVTMADEEVCSGCITHREKTNLNWEGKLERLKDAVVARRRARQVYDCVLPVVGDAEDFFTLSTLLALDLRPLVVNVNSYFLNDIGWWNLHTLITHFDVDSVFFNPEWSTYRELVKTSLRKYNHVLLPFLQLHTAYPVHVALQKRIPCVIWPQHQALDRAGKFSHEDQVEMTRWSRREHDLFRTEISALTGSGAEVSERQLQFYQYPDTQRLHARGVVGFYLNNYIPWDPLKQNQRALAQGYKAEQQCATFDPYERAGSSVYYQFHDLSRLLRCGHRKVLDHVAREVRHGRVDSQEARTLYSHYASQPVDVTPLFDWLQLTQTGRNWLLENPLSRVRDLIKEDAAEAAAPPLPEAITQLLPIDSNRAETTFITVGKGIELSDTNRYGYGIRATRAGTTQ